MAIQRRNPMDELTRWRPFRDLEDFTERMGQVFGNLGRFEETRLGLADWSPSVDITETDGEYLITAELPGVKKTDVHVTTEEGHLILKGERKESHEEKGKKVHRIERSYGSFYQSFALPPEVDDKKIAAEYKDGVLHVHLPKGEKRSAKGKEIAVS